MTSSTRTSLFAAVALGVFSSAASAQVVNLNTGFMPDPQSVNGVAGGPVSAQNVQPNCRGYIPAQPTQVLLTPTGFQFLRVFAVAGGDTTLMVRGTTGTWCADDTYGFNPGLDLTNLPPGRYDIYVGTYSQGQAFPYTLTFSELQSTRPTGNTGVVPPPPPPPPPQTNILGPTLPPNFGRILVPANLRGTRQATGRTGGSLSANSLQGEGTCRGYITSAPDHVMLLTSMMPYLHLFVTSAADSTLIVRRPDGTLLCNDDTYGLNPSIEGSFQAGFYQVWVGGYHAGETRPYRLSVTANPTAHP